MARIVVLDAGPLGLAIQAPDIARADDCRRWIRDLDVTAVDPEIVAELAERRQDRIRVGRDRFRVDVVSAQVPVAGWPSSG